MLFSEAAAFQVSTHAIIYLWNISCVEIQISPLGFSNKRKIMQDKAISQNEGILHFAICFFSVISY